jgi:two-component system chemotaxis response regulator CheY
MVPLDVLVVDDSAGVRKILQRFLTHSGIPMRNCFEAVDGEDALQQLRSQSINLVLSDINMPKLDGLGLLRAVRAEAALEKIPVVLITTDCTTESVLQALELGASGFIRKPFQPEQITETLLACAKNLG